MTLGLGPPSNQPLVTGSHEVRVDHPEMLGFSQRAVTRTGLDRSLEIPSPQRLEAKICDTVQDEQWFNDTIMDFFLSLGIAAPLSLMSSVGVKFETASRYQLRIPSPSIFIHQ